MTIESRLAEIRARVEAATEGPWEVSCGVDANGVTRASAPITWDDHGGEVFEPADAEFIAASRTDLPALLAAVEAVLGLHTTGGACPDCDAGPSTVCECGPADCQGCTETWPCPTVRAITTALDANTTTREDPS